MSNALLALALVLIGVGAYSARSWTWTTASAPVSACVSKTTYGGGKNHTKFPHQECTATWTASGSAHTSRVLFDADHDISGTTQQIQIHGAGAVAYERRYQGPLMILGGILLAVVGIVVRIRARLA